MLDFWNMIGHMTQMWRRDHTNILKEIIETRIKYHDEYDNVI